MVGWGGVGLDLDHIVRITLIILITVTILIMVTLTYSSHCHSESYTNSCSARRWLTSDLGHRTPNPCPHMDPWAVGMENLVPIYNKMC